MDTFIEKAYKIHGNTYGYDRVKYVKSSIKVEIYCKICDKYFLVRPNSHISKKSGCPDCGTRRMKQIQSLGIDKFIKHATDIHGEKYNYDQAIYVNNRTKLQIYCKKCEKYFNQTPGDHINNKSGCFDCGHKSSAQKISFTREKFIEKSISIFGNTYGYDRVNYKTMYIKVEIHCKKCNKYFSKLPVNHIHNKQGCPFCRMSKGEIIIGRVLEKYKIPNIRESNIKCTDINNNNKIHILRVDYLLTSLNAVIEFDGQQHFTETKFFKNKLNDTRNRDIIKNNFCMTNGLSILRIHYQDIKNIEKLILSFINKLKYKDENHILFLVSRNPYW
jgi:very-short-patch-repair endonuclease